jgi:hypothetical protein
MNVYLPCKEGSIVMNRLQALCLLLLAVAILAFPVTSDSAARSQSWDFSVLLDGNKIGYHRFELTDLGDERRVTSEAKFDVRILFINAFRYRHENTEVWSDGCLRKIDARTQANGKKLAVSGTQIQGEFIIDDGRETNALSDCVMTFAYWDPEFLQQPKLLNSQSGEYIDVEVESLGNQPITVRGQEVAASAYRLTAKKLQVTLWYSTDNEWLALESVAKGGRIIRYELT